jgi:deoxycytidylate deaminase
MNYKKIIEISYALAGKCRHNKRCRHFSFIFKNKRLISIGMNSPKTHPLNLKYDYINKQKHNISDVVGTHSELRAVIKLGLSDYRGYTLVNTRINRNQELDYSLPCNGCMQMIRELGFDRVIYTTKNKDFESLDLNSTILNVVRS